MRLFAFILLLLHVNFSMFIAQIDEKDIYDADLRQVHDINSLSEFIQYSLSNNKDQHKTKDSDDDNARYFHALKPHYFVVQPSALLKKETSLYSYRSIPLQNENSLSSGFFEILAPPPKA